MDQSKEATFKVAPSKWEAVDEAELQAQGETLKMASNYSILDLNVHCHRFFHMHSWFHLCCAFCLLLSCDNFKMGDF